MVRRRGALGHVPGNTEPHFFIWRVIHPDRGKIVRGGIGDLPIELLDVEVATNRRDRAKARAGISAEYSSRRRTYDVVAGNAAVCGCLIQIDRMRRPSSLVHIIENALLGCTRKEPVVGINRARLLLFGKRAEEEQLILDNGTADAAAEIIQLDRILRLRIGRIDRGQRIVFPAIGV